MLIKELIKSAVSPCIWTTASVLRHKYFPTYAQKCYSQEGEDLILERFLGDRKSGFYVDVGAHHPKRFSNTYRLYRRGWRGLNIDAAPGSMRAFRRVRSADLNVEGAVAAQKQELTFYVFNESALNTFERELAMKRANGSYRIVREVTITTETLADLLARYVPTGVTIDLLSVDVEGLDYDVLRSNDWSRYRPEYIVAECLDTVTAEEASNHVSARFLAEQKYAMVAKTMNSVIFKNLQV